MAAEEDMVVSQILDELGVAQGDLVPDAPSQGKKQEAATAVETNANADPAMSELEARLNNLKRS